MCDEPFPNELPKSAAMSETIFDQEGALTSREIAGNCVSTEGGY